MGNISLPYLLAQLSLDNPPSTHFLKIRRLRQHGAEVPDNWFQRKGLCHYQSATSDNITSPLETRVRELPKCACPDAYRKFINRNRQRGTYTGNHRGVNCECSGLLLDDCRHILISWLRVMCARYMFTPLDGHSHVNDIGWQGGGHGRGVITSRTLRFPSMYSSRDGTLVIQKSRKGYSHITQN